MILALLLHNGSRNGMIVIHLGPAMRQTAQWGSDELQLQSGPIPEAPGLALWALNGVVPHPAPQNAVRQDPPKANMAFRHIIAMLFACLAIQAVWARPATRRVTLPLETPAKGWQCVRTRG